MQALWILGGVAIISIIIVTVTIWTKKAKWQQHNKALTSIKQLKSVTSLLQKHRGICAAYLQDNTQSPTAISDLVKQISPLVTNLNYTSMINQQDRWKRFTEHWERLSKSATNLSLENSFLQHTDMVSNLLYLLEDIAEQQHFNKNTFESLPNISLLWRELPFSAEYIGQSRAMGVAVAASGLSTQVDKVKLGYLQTKITELSTQVFLHFKNHGNHTSEQTQLIKFATEACKRLIDVLEQEFLHCAEVKIASQQYFTIASESMDAINRLLDYELQQVEQHLKQSY